MDSKQTLFSLIPSDGIRENNVCGVTVSLSRTIWKLLANPKPMHKFRDKRLMRIKRLNGKFMFSGLMTVYILEKKLSSLQNFITHITVDLSFMCFQEVHVHMNSKYCSDQWNVISVFKYFLLFIAFFFFILKLVAVVHCEWRRIYSSL